MVVLMAAVGVLMAGALLPLAFDDADDGSDDENIAMEPEALDAGDLLDDLDADGAPVDAVSDESGAALSDDLLSAEASPDDPDGAVRAEGEISHGPDVVPVDGAQPPYALGSAALLGAQDDVLTSDEAESAADDEPTHHIKEWRDGRAIVEGSEAEDTMDVPHRALVTGGKGADVFRLDAGTPIGEQAELTDFDPEVDQLAVVWDDAAGNLPPKVSFGAIEDAEDLSQLIVDGVVIAHVANCDSMMPADVQLVARSSL